MVSQKTVLSKQLQYTLYRHAYSDAIYYIGDQDDKLKRYTRNFYNTLPKSFTETSYQEIINTCQNNTLTLVGDFHTCKFAQNTFVNLISNYLSHSPKQPILVLLEMFSREHQAIIDEYLKGKIEEHELLDKTKYKSTWGFSWDNYKPIVDLCKQSAIQIYGIDEPKLSFENREAGMAKNIRDISCKHDNTKVFSLLGECHLAPQHLPRHLQADGHRATQDYKKIDFNRVLQNIDQYYFQLISHGIQEPHTALQLAPKLHCIMNTAVWKKWRSVEEWYEQQDEENDHEDYDYDIIF